MNQLKSESVTPEQMHAYAKYRGCASMKGTFKENYLGAWIIIRKVEDRYKPLEKHFSRVIERSNNWLVMIRKEHYNADFTDGKLTAVPFEPEPYTNDYLY